MYLPINWLGLYYFSQLMLNTVSYHMNSAIFKVVKDLHKQLHFWNDL